MKICVFVDYQNVYMDARTAFGFENKGHTWGQIDPLLFGQLFCAKDSPNISSKSKVLSQVRIYTGCPQWQLASETNAAYLRQKASWEQIGQVEVVDRPLQYIKGQPPRQKGVDVAMALDIVTLGSSRARNPRLRSGGFHRYRLTTSDRVHQGTGLSRH